MINDKDTKRQGELAIGITDYLEEKGASSQVVFNVSLSVAIATAVSNGMEAEEFISFVKGFFCKYTGAMKSARSWNRGERGEA